MCVQRSPDAAELNEIIRDRLTQTIQTPLIAQRINVTHLVTVTVLDPPNQL